MNRQSAARDLGTQAASLLLVVLSLVESAHCTLWALRGDSPVWLSIALSCVPMAVYSRWCLKRATPPRAAGLGFLAMDLLVALFIAGYVATVLARPAPALAIPPVRLVIWSVAAHSVVLVCLLAGARVRQSGIKGTQPFSGPKEHPKSE